MSVFKVVFTIASPIYRKLTGSKNPIMADGLLARVALARKGISKTPAEISAENLVFADLPIERVGKCYLCSSMFLPDNAYSCQDALAGREVDAAGVRLFHPTFSAANRPALKSPDLLVHDAVTTETTTFYARVIDGREDEFLSLVKKASEYGIGPKTSVGYGKSTVLVQEGAPDWSYKKDGLPTRPLPKELFAEEFAGVPDVPVGMSCYYAPYWFRRNAVPCFLPPPSQYAGFETAISLLDNIAIDIEDLESAAKKKGGKEPARPAKS